MLNAQLLWQKIAALEYQLEARSFELDKALDLTSSTGRDEKFPAEMC